MDGIVRLLEPVRSRLLWVGGALLVGTLALVPAQHVVHHERVSLARHHCADLVQEVVRQPVHTMKPIELERRWLLDHASPAAVDDSLRTHVEGWQPFMYLLDAQPRMAVASVHPTNVEYDYQFGQDETGGIWLVSAKLERTLKLDVLLYQSDIFLLPAGTSFRGVIER